MAKQLLSVFVEPDAWVFGFQNDDPSGIALHSIDVTDDMRPRVDEWLTREAIAHESPVVLGLSAGLCYASKVSTAGLTVRNRHTGLRFRLEANLPVDLEDLTVRALDHGGQDTLVLGAVTASWKSVAERLALSGIDVDSIVPTPIMVAAESAVRDGMVLIESSESRFDLLELDGGGRFIGWSHLPGDSSWVKPEIAETGRSLKAYFGVSYPFANDQTIGEQGAVNILDEPSLVTATRFAKRVLDADATPQIDFSTEDGQGHPRWQAWRPVVAILLILVWAGVALSWAKVAQFRSMTDGLRTDLEMAYTKQFPDERPPASLLPRLRSQYRLLGSEAQTPSFDALSYAVEILTALSTESNFTIDGMSMTSSTFRMSGSADSLGAVDSLAQAIAEAETLFGGNELNPPATQILPSGRLRYELTSTNPQATAGGLP
ncbi:MAG: hypothetical protein AAGJ38_00725 [Planctomycetota bacterium]